MAWGFRELDSWTRQSAFMDANFPDITPRMPGLRGEFEEHKIGLMGTVHCQAWHAGGTALLIGASGVSAVPMAARVANKVGLEANPHNILLMHAMGPNVAGVIGTVIAAGIFLIFARSVVVLVWYFYRLLLSVAYDFPFYRAGRAAGFDQFNSMV